jgi:hypothetical protein
MMVLSHRELLRFNAACYRGAQGFLLVYDVTDEGSFRGIQDKILTYHY